MAILEYSDFMEAVADYLGYSRNSSNWSSEQQSRMNEIVQSGLRQFYYPPVLPNDRMSYKWTFLAPVATLSTEADTGDYDLPSDFGGLKVHTIKFDEELGYSGITVMGEGKLRQARENHSATGRPEIAAVRTKSFTDSQSYEVLFAPVPDGVYDLTYNYFVNPSKLSDLNPIPYGGAIHSETILQSCLAVAEQRLNDKKGFHFQSFIERLEASITQDKQVNSPDLVSRSRKEYGGNVRRSRSDIRNNFIVSYD